MLSPIRRWIRQHPLLSVILLGALLRLLAVLFAKGYLASDDHFLIIRPAADWLHGLDTVFSDAEPPKRGMLYTYAIHALLWTLKQLGVTDPGHAMLVNRLLHALWSLTLIPLVYLFVHRLADQRAALAASLLMAAHFIVPFMAVRNLVEVVSQVPLMAGILLAEGGFREGRERPHSGFYAGLFLGLAFMIRIQTALVPAAVFVALLALRRWRTAGAFAAGGLLMLLIEGIIDYLSFGVFLSSVVHSVVDQSKQLHSYVTGPWYSYLATVAGALIPPFSLLALYWIVRAARRAPLAFWGMLVFLIVHSIIPQKQERFILPILPLLFALLAVGWSMVSWRDRRWVRGLWIFFWVVNILLLPVSVFNYSQKARVEPLLELGRGGETGGIIAVTVENPQWLPYYYAGYAEDDFYYVMEPATLDTLHGLIADRQRVRGLAEPTHVVLFTHKSPTPYVQKLQQELGPLELQRHIGPSLADWLLHKMNPRFNHSKESYVFRLKEPYAPPVGDERKTETQNE